MPERAIAIATGIAEIRAVPRVLRAGVPEGGYMSFSGYTGFFVTAAAKEAIFPPPAVGFCELYTVYRTQWLYWIHRMWTHGIHGA